MGIMTRKGQQGPHTIDLDAVTQRQLLAGDAGKRGIPDSPFVAHLVARRRFWRGRAAVAMNAAWLGPYNLGPRAHPNDGLLDIADATLPMRALLLARTRARSGAHVPHPEIDGRRVPAAQLHFDRPVLVRLDGDAVGSFRDISLRIEPIRN